MASPTFLDFNNAISTTTSLLPTDKRCSYPSKICTHARAVKQNKTLHRLCEFHRRKANLNQQRMQQRRRLLHQYAQDTVLRRNNSPAASDQLEFMNEFHTPLESEFSPEELRVLERMLFNSSDESECELEASQDLITRRPRGNSKPRLDC